MATKIQIRRDTAANWTAQNPVLSSGEPALETDTRKEKIGDGSTAWNALPYKSTGGAVASVNTQTGTVVLTQDNVADGATAKQYTATEKTKLGGIAAGATANDTDVNLKNRANHTGTQAAATIVEDSTHRFATDAEKSLWNGGSVTYTADHALIAGDSGKLVYIDSATDTILTVPAGLPLNFYCTIIAIGGGTVTLDISAVTNTGSSDLTITDTNSRVIHVHAADIIHVFGGGSGSAGNAAPVASSVAFTGTQTQGQTLTGTYTYSDVDSDAEGTSLKKWYRSDNNSGLNRAAISGATNSTYVLQAGDVGKYIQFGVTPKAATGVSTGTEVLSGYSGAIAASGGGTIFLTKGTTTGTVTESPAHSFNGANGANCVFVETCSGDGYVEAEITAGASGNVLVLGLDEDNTAEGVPGFKWFVFTIDSTNLYADQNGGPGVDTGIAYTSGMKVRFIITGTAITAEYWDGAAWQALYVFTQARTTTTTPLYAKADFAQTSSGNNTLGNVKALGFA